METIELKNSNASKLAQFGLFINKMPGIVRVWVLILLILCVVGCYALVLQIVKGHGVTGMRDHIAWGYYIVNFIYFIGISYGAAAFTAILYFFNIPWGKPIIRISTLVAFITGVIGPVFILLCIGRFDRLHYLFIHARVQSPITWDVLVISTYLVGISLFTYLVFIDDYAILKNLDFVKKRTWRKKMYKILSIGYNRTEAQQNEVKKARKSMSFILVPKVILAWAVLSWIFGMTLRPGWHSTIFGPSYIISSTAACVGLIILVMWVYRNLFKMEAYFQDIQFRKLSILLLALVSIFGYFTFTEYITNWYSSFEWETNLMNKLLGWGKFGILFHMSNLFGIVIPVCLLIFKKFRTPNVIAGLSLLVVISIWVRRFLTVVPTLETTLVPIQDTRVEYFSYSATWVEWALVVAGAAVFLLFFTLIPRLVNIIPFSFNQKVEQES